MSTKKLAKYFAPLFIGNPHTPIEDGLKKLQDLKEQQMVIMLNRVYCTTFNFYRFEKIDLICR